MTLDQKVLAANPPDHEVENVLHHRSTFLFCGIKMFQLLVLFPGLCSLNGEVLSGLFLLANSDQHLTKVWHQKTSSQESWLYNMFRQRVNITHWNKFSLLFLIVCRVIVYAYKPCIWMSQPFGSCCLPRRRRPLRKKSFLKPVFQLSKNPNWYSNCKRKSFIIFQK